MNFSKVSAWFLTPRGKTFSYFLAGGVTTCVLIGHSLPQSIFLEEYVNIIRLYKNGMSVPITTNLQQRFQKALTLSGIPKERHILYRPFSVSGFDVTSAGTGYSKFGVYIGLPVNFYYNEQQDIDKAAIRVGEISIPWETDEGKSLAQSLLLSEDAQIYAIAREICLRDTPKVLIDTVLGTIACVGTYGIASNLNARFNYYSKPLVVRLVLYSLIGLFSLGNYLLCKDMSQIYFEGKVDKYLIEKNPIFAKGGMEYYNRLLQRNVALRKLLGREGEKAFSAVGNDIYFFRNKHLPLLERKQLFEKTVLMQ